MPKKMAKSGLHQAPGLLPPIILNKLALNYIFSQTSSLIFIHQIVLVFRTLN